MGMQKDHESTLIELGLSKNEAKVYLALLSIGECSAGCVADKSKLHRPNVYDALERLIERGFVSYHMEGKVKIFKAADPEQFQRLLKEKELKLQQILPQLDLAKKMGENQKTVAEVLEGMKAFRRALENFLNYEEPIYVYGLPKIVPELLKTWIGNFHKKRLAKKIEMHHIYNQDAKERIDFLNAMPHTFAVYLPSEFNSPVTTNICGDEVMFTTWKPMVTVRIVNKEMAQAYEKYAKLLIKAGKK